MSLDNVIAVAAVARAASSAGAGLVISIPAGGFRRDHAV